MASYNSYLPTYSPYVYGATAAPGQTWAQPSAQQTQQLNLINWVQGEAGAKSVSVPAGQTALLMDSETNVFYLKSSDVSGIPLPLRKFSYEEVSPDETTDGRAPSTYVTKEELDERLQQLTTQLMEDKTNGKFDI